jgi:hypothetical protein
MPWSRWVTPRQSAFFANERRHGNLFPPERAEEDAHSLSSPAEAPWGRERRLSHRAHRRPTYLPWMLLPVPITLPPAIGPAFTQPGSSDRWSKVC